MRHQRVPVNSQLYRNHPAAGGEHRLLPPAPARARHSPSLLLGPTHWLCWKPDQGGEGVGLPPPRGGSATRECAVTHLALSLLPHLAGWGLISGGNNLQDSHWWKDPASPLGPCACRHLICHGENSNNSVAAAKPGAWTEGGGEGRGPHQGPPALLHPVSWSAQGHPQTDTVHGGRSRKGDTRGTPGQPRQHRLQHPLPSTPDREGRAVPLGCYPPVLAQAGLYPQLYSTLHHFLYFLGMRSHAATAEQIPSNIDLVCPGRESMMISLITQISIASGKETTISETLKKISIMIYKKRKTISFWGKKKKMLYFRLNKTFSDF